MAVFRGCEIPTTTHDVLRATSKVERGQRFAISMPLSYRVPGEAVWHEGTVENISRSGILFCADAMMPPQTPLEMAFRLPVEVGGQGSAEVLCAGSVARTAMRVSKHQPAAIAALILSFRFVRDGERSEV